MAAATPSILWLGRRWPLERGTWPARAALHAGCAIAVAGLAIAVLSVVARALGFLGPLPIDSVAQGS